MNTIRLPEQFIADWLKAALSNFPDTDVVKAVAEATRSARLDETKLLTQLRELATEALNEKRDDKG